MFIQKALIWSLIYPVMVILFFLRQLKSTAWFLFNSPVDSWVMISNAVEEAVKEI